MHTGSRCSRVSSSQVPDPAAPRFSAGWLHPRPGLLQWNKVYAPFYLGGGWGWGSEEGISHKLFSHNQALKKQQSQKRMRRNKQHTFFLELRHPDRNRQADPHPHPGYMTPCSHSSPGLPACLIPSPTTQLDGGVVTGR